MCTRLYFSSTAVQLLTVFIISACMFHSALLHLLSLLVLHCSHHYYLFVILLLFSIILWFQRNNLLVAGTVGRNSLLVVCWARCPAWASVSWVWSSSGRIFSGRGDFPLELTWALTPFPPNSFGWGYTLRSSLSTHAFHRSDSWH